MPASDSKRAWQLPRGRKNRSGIQWIESDAWYPPVAVLTASRRAVRPCSFADVSKVTGVMSGRCD